jgi:hypothetical protein
MQNARAAADVLSGGNLHPQGIAIRLFFQGPRMIYGPKADGHLGDGSAQDTNRTRREGPRGCRAAKRR